MVTLFEMIALIFNPPRLLAKDTEELKAPEHLKALDDEGKPITYADADDRIRESAKYWE